MRHCKFESVSLLLSLLTNIYYNSEFSLELSRCILRNDDDHRIKLSNTVPLSRQTIQSGSDSIVVHEAVHGTGGRRPAVIVLPAIAGINDYVKSRAADLNAAGYHVALMDYYSREGKAPDCSTPEAIGRAVAALPDPRVVSDIRATQNYLASLEAVDDTRIGILGFCIGGMYAFLAACESAALACVVSYYGTVRYTKTSLDKPHSPIDRIPELNAPLLAHFGTFDRLISQQEIADFEAALKRSKKIYECAIYSGSPHAFDEYFREAVFRPVASAEAWRRTLTFVDWYLQSKHSKGAYGGHSVKEESRTP